MVRPSFGDCQCDAWASLDGIEIGEDATAVEICPLGYFDKPVDGGTVLGIDVHIPIIIKLKSQVTRIGVTHILSEILSDFVFSFFVLHFQKFCFIFVVVCFVDANIYPFGDISKPFGYYS